MRYPIYGCGNIGATKADKQCFAQTAQPKFAGTITQRAQPPRRKPHLTHTMNNLEPTSTPDRARSADVARYPAPVALVDALVAALYECDNVHVTGDGCSTRSRDEWLLRRAVAPVVANWCSDNAPKSSSTEPKIP